MLKKILISSNVIRFEVCSKFVYSPCSMDLDNLWRQNKFNFFFGFYVILQYYKNIQTKNKYVGNTNRYHILIKM